MVAGLLVGASPGRARAERPLAEFVRAARARGFEAREGEALVEQRAAEAERAWQRLLPSLTASAELVRNQYEAVARLPAAAGEAPREAVITPRTRRELTAAVTMPLVDVGAWYSVASSVSAREAERARRASGSLDVDGRVASAYYRLLGAEAVAAAARRKAKTAEENAAFVAERHGAGLATELDLRRARSEIARDEQAVAEAEYAVASLRRSLETLSGLEAPAGGAPPRDDLREEAPLADWLPRAASHPSARAAALDADAAEKGAAAQRAALWPTLSAQASERFTNAAGFGASPAYAFGLVATWRLDPSTPAAARALEAAALASRVRSERASRAAADQVYDAWHKVRAQAAKGRAARAEREAAGAASALARERYGSGRATLLEVLQAERDEFAAEVACAQADAELAAARAALRLAAGRPLEGGAP